jgi:MarR family transcriptional regulator for hemolysin
MYTSTIIKKAARLLAKQANALLKSSELTHGYTYFLLELFKKDGQTQAQLQKAVGLDHSTIVRTLDRMERDSLIERRASTTDRRVFHIFLTKKGKTTQKGLINAADTLNHILLDGFSKDEQKVFHNLIMRMIINLESQ